MIVTNIKKLLFTIIVSVVLIILGALLTISIIFFWVGIPLTIIGALVLLFGILSFIESIFGSIFSLPHLFKPKKTPTKNPKSNKKKSKKVIDVSEEEGVFK